ncbi:MAG TPA: HD domain-containing protein [Candidatus Saccharimonadales bacterium]|nr:HD domain-containing protein [Candidatus Saccharimonadales bacterium]
MSCDELLSSRYLYALELVAQLFVNHTRDVSGVPFVTHLFGVSYIVRQLTEDEDVHIAALLHDTLEDIPPERYSAESIKVDFGSRVLKLVLAVTHDDRRYEPHEARQRYLQQLQKAPAAASLISGADMLYNGRDILYWYERRPKEIKARFGGSRAQQRRWFWNGRLEIIASKLGVDHVLVAELRALVSKLEIVYQKIM